MLLIGTVIVNAVLSGIPISLFGLIGVAIVTTATLGVWRAAMGVCIWRKLHSLPVRFSLCRCRFGRSLGWVRYWERSAGMRRGVRWLGCLAMLLALSVRVGFATSDLSGDAVVATPDMPEPGYLQPAIDPAFGTPFKRITDPSRELLSGVACGPEYCTHRYSSAQAWNADQSLLVVINGCHGGCGVFLDGQTYSPLFSRTIPNECEWHPTLSALMICVAGNRIYLWAPRTNVKTTIYSSDTYRNLQFGPYKGNPSWDGSRLVVRAKSPTGALVSFAYDIRARKKYSDIPLECLEGANGYCTISPSGSYIFCSQKLPDDINHEYVFTLDGVEVQHWTENDRPSHGDLTIDSDGSDVYVGISKADPDKYHIIKRRLKDGMVMDLAPYGEGQHASLRSTRLPGWVFVTFSGSFEEVMAHPDWSPFYQEIVALRIDGRGEIRRLVQTRDARSDYWSEAHASPSPDGSQVIWSSNWGKPGAPVADFVARVSWPRPLQTNRMAHPADGHSSDRPERNAQTGRKLGNQ